MENLEFRLGKFGIMNIIDRKLTSKILQAIKVFRVVIITGARQTGKTTLVKQLARQNGFVYYNLEDQDTRTFANEVPLQFLSPAKNSTVVIDEIQLIPELISFIKNMVDQYNRPGMFILTGSADILKIKKVKESLAGRAVYLELKTLSTAEIYGRSWNLIDRLSAAENFTLIPKNAEFNTLIDFIIRGGYPGVRNLTDSQRELWFESYVSARIVKDLENITVHSIRKQDLIPKILNYLAYQSAELLKFSKIANEFGVDVKTAKSYVSLLEMLYLVEIVNPYFSNLAKRLIKTPKLFFNDTGLLSYYLKAKTNNYANFLGKLAENFVFSELTKDLTWSEVKPQLYFYRDKYQNEVDFLLETSLYNLVAIEVKAKQVVKEADFRNLIAMAKAFDGTKINLQKAYVFYLGKFSYTKQVAGLDVNLVSLYTLFN